MVSRGTRRCRAVAAVVVAALLLLACPAWAETPPAGEGGSKLQYVVRGAFVLTAALILFVVIRAALSKPDDTTRLAAATARLDRAMGLSSPGSTPNRPGNDVGLRVARHYLQPFAVAARTGSVPVHDTASTPNQALLVERVH